MADLIGGNNEAAIKVAVYAALTYDVISATNSSPQTTEINASARADTLMKWVKLGLAQAALFAGIGIALDKQRWPAALGAGLAGGLLWMQYVYAKKSGLQNPQLPATETNLTTVRPVYRGQAQVTQLVSAPQNYGTIQETQEHARGQR